jgi:tubulin-specific chaperone A
MLLKLSNLSFLPGVVKRLAKEKTVYEKESDREKQRLEKFKSENRDEHDLRKQEEVINECLMMVPDCQRR